MRCFIIDDEPLARKGLKEFIDQTPNLSCIGVANNPLEALSELAKLSPDLLFLDIHMPQMDGLEFVNQFKPKMPIIYTTAYSKYAVDSFDLDIEDYLLKPLQYDRFLRAIARVYKALETKNINSKVEELKKDYFFVRTDGSLQKITTQKILFLKSIQNYVKIYLGEDHFIVHQTLKSFEEILPSHQFKKVQKSYIVNFHKIDRLDGYILKLGVHDVPISRKLMKEIRAFLLRKTIIS